MKHKRQPSLFGEAPSPGVGPAEIAEGLQQVAIGLPPEIRLGTSSWSFPGWSGLVYDRAASKSVLARRGLAAYARHPLLRTVGIDRTFYAPISAEAFAEYAAAVPGDFRFLVKAASQCTSERSEWFLDASWAGEEVVGPFVDGLSGKAGPLVFQFPPLGREITAEPARFAERLGEFLGRLPRGPLYAVELRDRGLLCDDYFSALEGAGASHCHSLHPRLPSLSEQRRLAGGMAAGPFIARWMLNARLGYEEAVQRYEPFSVHVDEDPAARDALAAACVAEASRGREVFVVANNKAEGSAPLSVFKLAESIVRRR